MDKYQILVEELLTIQPEDFLAEVECRWNNDHNNNKGCLFAYCSPNNYFLSYNNKICGCITQVKSGEDVAYTEELTQLIRNNPLIPESPNKIKQDRAVLEEFAKLQRHMDETIRKS